jgi:hypothetical protein
MVCPAGTRADEAEGVGGAGTDEADAGIGVLEAACETEGATLGGGGAIAVRSTCGAGSGAAVVAAGD